MTEWEEQRIERAFEVMDKAFKKLAKEGFSPAQINGLVMGMCMRNLESALGKENAIACDKEAMKAIGWI